MASCGHTAREHQIIIHGLISKKLTLEEVKALEADAVSLAELREEIDSYGNGKA